MQDIMIIAQYTQAPGEFENDRFRYIAERIPLEKAKVEVVTMSFSHHMKKQRCISDEQLNALPYKMTFIPVADYEKNVSIKRIYSNWLMGKNLKKYLKQRNKPDVIYCAVPSLDAGYKAAQYARKNKVRFIIDVQDLWPEAFKLAVQVPVLKEVAFLPMQRKANYIYESADNVLAVSETYAERAMRVNRKCKQSDVVFLGTELATFDMQATAHPTVDKSEQEVWMGYVGTLGHSYDLTCVIDALAILQKKGVKNLKFLVMGDGPLKNRFENYAREKKINAVFTGRLPYTEMVRKLCACDIAVNPINTGAAQSIINKHGDYAAAGLPVINTQECLEYRKLLETYDAGFNCRSSDPYDMSKKIEHLYVNENIRKRMGRNSRRIAEERFDRAVTYQRIFELLNV